MSVNAANIVLDKTYNPGQTVSGKLEFKQEKAETCRGIHVTAIGYCWNYWNSQNGNNTETHTENEVYYEKKTYLIGGEKEKVDLKATQYSFPFEVTLPPNCPSSYEGKFGCIRYEFRFVMDRIMKFDLAALARINVIALKDLKDDPTAREPLLIEFNHVLRNWCCINKGKYQVTVKVPRSGFCPGEMIPIELDCRNNSSIGINKIKLVLARDVTFRAQSKLKNDQDVLQTLIQEGVKGRRSQRWSLQMLVPEIEVPNVDGCKLIDIDYGLWVTVVPAGCNEDFEATGRIVLGNIPLQDSDRK